MAEAEPLRAELESGFHWVYKLLTHTSGDIRELGVTILALVEELTENALVDATALGERMAAKTEKELERLETHDHVRVGEPVDKYAQTELPDIDCASLMHLCKGKCCTMPFPLGKQDLDERIVEWDYRRPYLIRQRKSDGYCVHNDPATRGCGVYANRPVVCRLYDCREDKRVWLDFENRIPAG